MAVYEYKGIQIDSGKAVKGYRMPTTPRHCARCCGAKASC